jgi:hypothetical protein
MVDIDAHPLLITDTMAVWDVVCSGICKHESSEECLATTHLVFPYRRYVASFTAGCHSRPRNRDRLKAEFRPVRYVEIQTTAAASHPCRDPGMESLARGLTSSTDAPSGSTQPLPSTTPSRGQPRCDTTFEKPPQMPRNPVCYVFAKSRIWSHLIELSI